MSDPTIKDPLMRGMLVVACIALFLMMGVMVADVLLRAVFNMPVRGAYDAVSLCLLVMTMFGIGPVVAGRTEILIDLIDPFVPAAVLRVLGITAALAGLGLFGFCGWAMISPALDAWRYGDTSLELGLPLWTLWVAAFLGMVGVFWGYGLQLRAAMRSVQPASDEEGAL